MMPQHGEARNTRGFHTWCFPLPEGSERWCLACKMWTPSDSAETGRNCGECGSFWFGSPTMPKPEEAAFLLAVLDGSDHKTWKTRIRVDCLEKGWVDKSSYYNRWWKSIDDKTITSYRLTDAGLRAIELYTASPKPKSVSTLSPEEDFFGKEGFVDAD